MSRLLMEWSLRVALVESRRVSNTLGAYRPSPVVAEAPVTATPLRFPSRGGLRRSSREPQALACDVLQKPRMSSPRSCNPASVWRPAPVLIQVCADATARWLPTVVLLRERPVFHDHPARGSPPRRVTVELVTTSRLLGGASTRRRPASATFTVSIPTHLVAPVALAR